MELATQAASGTRRTRCIPVVITSDIRNVFNSTAWQNILDILAQRGISNYLRRMIQQNLKGRRILVKTEDDCLQMEVSSGVPQGCLY